MAGGSAAGGTAEVNGKHVERAVKDESRLYGEATRVFNAVAWRRAPVADGCDEQRPLSDAWRTQCREASSGRDTGRSATTTGSAQGGSRAMADAPEGPLGEASRWGGRVDRRY